MDEARNKDDTPSKEVKSAILGSTTGNLSELFKWTGTHKPNKAWLAEPLKNRSKDKIAKQTCTGCGMAGEASLTHLERISRYFGSGKDLSKVDWSKYFLKVNACDFCIESAPEKLMVELVLEELPQK